MKKLLITLFLFPIILQAQERGPFVEPNHTDGEQTLEFDERCAAPMRWSATLIFVRRAGITVEEVLQDLATQYHSGSLKGIPDEVLDYMLNIISIVFGRGSIETDEQMIEIFREVEGVCIKFIETSKKAKNPERSI